MKESCRTKAQRQEEAEKGSIIGRLGAIFGGGNWLEPREGRLREMTVLELRQLQGKANCSADLKETKEIIMAAICASEAARRAEDDRRFSCHPPARIDMTI
jgi:hypothetical protein